VLKAHALSHAKNFSWDISARKALDFIEARMTSSDLSQSRDATVELASGAELYAAFLERVPQIPGIAKLANESLLASAAALAANEIVAAQTLSDEKRSLKIGWVTTWNTRCGIASYTRHLVDNCACAAKIFAAATQDLTEPDGDEVVRCWTAACGDLRPLSDAIDRSGVDAVAIQMNYGFFDFPALSRLIEQQKQAGRVVTITLHATVDPPQNILNRCLADLAPALNACDAVLVHSLADVVNLEKIGVVENVVLFPQSVVGPAASVQRENRKTGTFTVSTYGFFLPHKGLEQVIEAIALLRNQGVEIELEMINAEYSPAASADLIRDCQALIEARGLTPYVRMTTAYLDEQDSLRRLADTDLVVFAYQGTGESSSAAVRMGLAAGTLVAVTPLTIFDDVHDLVLRLPGTAPDDIAQGIRVAMTMMVDDAPELYALRENSKRWVESHQSRHLARHFCNLVEQFASRGPAPRADHLIADQKG
jgi:glycosyltransferase involved in cell wall biosynthesis